MNEVLRLLDPKARKIVGEHRFQKTIGILNDHLNADSKVMEVGSTDATFSHFVPSAEWKTIDKYGNPDIHVDLNDVNLRLPINDNYFDAVICTEVLEHLVSGSSLIREMARTLKPNGNAIITVPNMVSLTSRIKWAIGRVPFMAASGDCGNSLGGTGMLVDGHWTAGHVVDFNQKRLREYLMRGGLNVVRNYSLGVNVKLFRMPGFLTPSTFSDFVAVVAKPSGK